MLQDIILCRNTSCIFDNNYYSSKNFEEVSVLCYEMYAGTLPALLTVFITIYNCTSIAEMKSMHACRPTII